MRFMAQVRHNAALRVTGLVNLFCAGEKSGPLVGHTEAIATGMLAGHNAARAALGMKPLALPRTTAVGDFVGCVTSAVRGKDHSERFTFAGAGFFGRMVRHGVYSTSEDVIGERVENAGFARFFDRPLA